MAHFYRAPQRDQLLLMPTSMQEWLEEGHLAWFLIDVVATWTCASCTPATRTTGSVARPTTRR